MSGASGPMVTDQTPSVPLVSGCGRPSSSPAAVTSRALGARYRNVIVRSGRTSGETTCAGAWASAVAAASAQPIAGPAILIINHLEKDVGLHNILLSRWQEPRKRCLAPFRESASHLLWPKEPACRRWRLTGSR